ncbi:hypothetical protein BCV70DRAFT_203252 [Testicularia cyperi]|uniref:SET domain-containing protein n=1 Tax=Testicularia cyperi TaxID=1882483 RepID=A0A317XEU7_9BASI|nr:hypothetical protein BCV70DRAFT_203252 [Testicularia cyperi]
MASVYGGHLSKGDGMLASQGHKPTHPSLIQVEFNNGSYNSRLIALQSFKQGQRITKFLPHASYTPHVSYSTVQVDEAAHIELNSDLLYCNHSCVPNVRFDVSGDKHTWAAIADRDIAKGDTLTFFYPSTEWSMSQPFDCACNSGASCLGKISGAKSIPASILANYFLNAHILRLKLQQLQSAAAAAAADDDDNDNANAKDIQLLLNGRDEVIARGNARSLAAPSTTQKDA